MYRSRIEARGSVLAMSCVFTGLGFLWSPGGEAGACRKHIPPQDPRPVLSQANGRYEVQVRLGDHYFRFPGSNLRLMNIFVFSRDKALAAFLASAPGRQAAWAAFGRTARGLTCADVMHGGDLARLERALGAAILGEYRKTSRRAVAVPDVMLVLDGGYSAYCQPPRPKAVP